MEGLHLLDETFQRRESPLEPADDWGPPAEYTALKLRFSARVAYRVRDEFDRSQITAGEDGLPFGVHLVSRGGLDRRFSAFLWG